MSLCGTDYAIGAVRNMYRESRQDSAMVAMPSKLQKGLPRRTGSLCPECLKVIPATLYIGDGALKMKKTCKEHGEFDEACWSDVEVHLRVGPAHLVEFAVLLARLLHLEGAVADVEGGGDDLQAFRAERSGPARKPLLQLRWHGDHGAVLPRLAVHVSNGADGIVGPTERH